MDNRQNSININWYPGHMLKAKKQMIEDLKLIDVVVEVLDARIPRSSRNPDINPLIQNKKKIVILNKSDLADEKKNKQWIEYFKKQEIPAVLTNSNTGEGIKETVKEIERISKEIQQAYVAKGRVGKVVRVLILGIPNVGKSSFINRMSKKSTAQVGNRPGVTKQKQWIRVNQHIELMDTPGVLWPKFEDAAVALNLAYIGSIKDEVLHKTEIAFNLMNILVKEYLELLVKRYQLDLSQIEDILQKDIGYNEKILEIMQKIGEKRGTVIAGGRIDDEKVSNILLEDFRAGKIGKITLEEPK